MDYTATQKILGIDILPRVVRLIPNLSIAAIQHGYDKELALWYCLRTINHWGSGHLDSEYAVKALIDSFGYSRSTAYRILGTGIGIFWDQRPFKNFNRLQLKIYGLRKVAKYFDIRCGGYFLEIPIEEFISHTGNRVATQRSWLYASFHRPQGTESWPISRISITKATGVNRRSQQRYDKIASIKISNYAHRQDTNRKAVPITEFVDGKNRQWLIHKQLGNTYHCRGYRGRTGMIRKVNTAVRQSLIRGEACYLQRFFTTAKSYIKCHQRHEDSYVVLPVVNISINRRMAWCCMNS